MLLEYQYGSALVFCSSQIVMFHLARWTCIWVLLIRRRGVVVFYLGSIIFIRFFVCVFWGCFLRADRLLGFPFCYRAWNEPGKGVTASVNTNSHFWDVPEHFNGSHLKACGLANERIDFRLFHKLYFGVVRKVETDLLCEKTLLPQEAVKIVGCVISAPFSHDAKASCSWK